MSIQQLDQATNRFGTTKVGDFLNSHTSPDGTQLIDDPDIPTGTITITENGTGIDVYDYATADVAVPQDFTVNESYDISEGTLNTATVTLEGDVTAHIPDGVTTLGGDAFTNNDDITKVIMPNSVTSIGGGAFSYCTSLTSITIPDSVTIIGGDAFSSCSSLTSITIPDSVTSIGSSAFSGCTSLTSITIPDSIITISDYMFSGCTSLTSITIPDSVTSIRVGAFNNCTSLTDIYYTGTQAQWEQITIGTAAIPAGATIHYEYTPEETPSEEPTPE